MYVFSIFFFFLQRRRRAGGAWWARPFVIAFPFSRRQTRTRDDGAAKVDAVEDAVKPARVPGREGEGRKLELEGKSEESATDHARQWMFVPRAGSEVSSLSSSGQARKSQRRGSIDGMGGQAAGSMQAAWVNVDAGWIMDPCWMTAFGGQYPPLQRRLQRPATIDRELKRCVRGKRPELGPVACGRVHLPACPQLPSRPAVKVQPGGTRRPLERNLRRRRSARTVPEPHFPPATWKSPTHPATSHRGRVPDTADNAGQGCNETRLRDGLTMQSHSRVHHQRHRHG